MTTFMPIPASYPHEADIKRIDYEEEAKIKALLLGHRVEKADDEHLVLDDGTTIRVVPNEGGCACSAGDYRLTELNGCDNIITAVELVEDKGDVDEYGEGDRIYRVFVVAEDKRINLFAVSGDDGNGYYGTGYELLVRAPL